MEKQQIVSNLIILHNALSGISVQGKDNVLKLSECFSFLSQFIEALTQEEAKSEDSES